MDDIPQLPTQDEQPETSPATTLSYVRTHCMTCAAGWTRLDKDGRPFVVCLLNREPIMPEIAHCNRYEFNAALSPEEVEA